MLQFISFLAGLTIVVLTLSSAISTFVLPRSAPSRLNRIIFTLLRNAIESTFKFARSYRTRDAIMAYYAPVGLLMLVPTWYALTVAGYTLMYWSLGVGNLYEDFLLSGSSLLTLGFATPGNFWVSLLVMSEAVLGLVLVALLIAYLPTMYSAFSRREEAVNLLEVRAGNPPSAVEMLMRYYRNQGLERLSEYWPIWETWFANLEESHSTLPALVFFRSPRAENSWITAAGAVLDAAALTLSSVDIPYEISAALTVRAGFLALRRVADYFEIEHPADPHYPETPISISRAEFDSALERLSAQGVPLKADREQAWRDFAGWRVNYDRVLLALCTLVMAPEAPWSSDRARAYKSPPLFKKKLPA